MAFAETWKAIQIDLKPRMSIRKWSQDKGDLEGSFDVTRVEAEAIDVETEGGSVQRVGKRYFEAV